MIGGWIAPLFTAVLLAGSGLPVDASDLAERLSAYLERRSVQGFMGAVLVERSGETLLRAAYGPAEAELDVANRPAGVFRIGSLTKTFTATAVLRAVERGEMALDDRICASLSLCPSSWSGVTVHHLLSHTSGIPDSFGRLEAVPVEETAAELDRVLVEIAEEGEPLDSAPGEAYRYSNFNYVLLGVLLELAEGAPWAEVLAREIFRPLAMTGTAYDDVWAVVPGRVRGYGLRDGSLANTEYDDHAAYAAGGLRSTLDDLRRFLDAYFVPGSLLSAKSLDKALHPYLGDYGYGWQIIDRLGRTVYNHTGGIDGFSTHMARYPDDDVTVVVLSNNEDEPAPATACDLAAIVFGVDHVLSGRAVVDLSAEQFDRLAGTYEVAADASSFVLTATEGGLLYAREGGEALYRAVAPETFVLESRPDVTLRFDLGGAAPTATLAVCGHEIRTGRRR